ncbi:MAG: TIGR01777 family oxidoreductase, partial [Opitutales bacterium]
IRGDATRFWKRRTSREGVILVTGHRGMIGSALSAHLRTLGYSVRGLTRSPSGEDEFGWDPMKGSLDPAALEGLTAVVHLAGAGIADHRWTPSYKETLMESRRQGTRLLAEKLAALSEPPPVLVSVSGANFYPLDGKPHGEGGPHGEGFLAKVCEAWEGAADLAREAGLRVVHPRLGVVLSPRGGALAKMLPAFRGGVGGPIGSGRQMFSWIGLHDAVDILVRAIEDERYEGPVNAVAPEALPQREFARTLGRVLRRPSFAPLPAPVVRTLFGREMADETLLADLNLVPNKLREWGYGWRHGDLEAALRYYLGRPTKEARTALLAD